LSRDSWSLSKRFFTYMAVKGNMKRYASNVICPTALGRFLMFGSWLNSWLVYIEKASFGKEICCQFFPVVRTKNYEYLMCNKVKIDGTKVIQKGETCWLLHVHWLTQMEDSQLPVGSGRTQLENSSSISTCVRSDKTGRYSTSICVSYNTTWNITVASGLTHETADFYGSADIPHTTSTQTGVLPGIFFFLIGRTFFFCFCS
jgi:hypothetical protein